MILLVVGLSLSLGASPISTSCVSCALLAADPPEELTPPPLPPDVDEITPSEPLPRQPLLPEDELPLDPPAPELKKKPLTQDPHINSFSLRELGFAGIATFYSDITLPLFWLFGFEILRAVSGIRAEWQAYAVVHGLATIATVTMLQYGVADLPKENGPLLPFIGQLAGTAIQVVFFVLAATGPGPLLFPFLMAGLFTRYIVTPMLSSVLLHRRFTSQPIEPDAPGVEVFRF